MGAPAGGWARTGTRGAAARSERRARAPIGGPVAQTREVWKGFHLAALQEAVYLVPLRVFIGLGWLRAFAEKAIDPNWRDGASLAAFLERQRESGEIMFPAYDALVGELFLLHAAALGFVVMLGQLLAGLAILTGAATNAALLGGLFMNLNFLLAGATDPSAFYIVIQAVLLPTNAGAILGLDARLYPALGHPLLAARPAARGGPRVGAATLLSGAVAALGVAAYALVHVRDWSPGGSVHDPAMILSILATMAAAWSLLAFVRARHPNPSSPLPAASTPAGGGGGEPAWAGRVRVGDEAANRAPTSPPGRVAPIQTPGPSAPEEKFAGGGDRPAPTLARSTTSGRYDAGEMPDPTDGRAWRWHGDADDVWHDATR